MPLDNKVKTLKRSHPGEEDEEHPKDTDQMLANVITLLESQKKAQESAANGNKQPENAEQGVVPPPNTPCTRD